MNNLQKIGILAGLAVVTVTGTYYLTPKGYEGQCASAITQSKLKFDDECANKTAASLHSGSLDNILLERDAALKLASCPLKEEEWYCGQGNTQNFLQYPLQSGFKTRVEKPWRIFDEADFQM